MSTLVDSDPRTAYRDASRSVPPTVTTEPTEEPVSVDEARRHLRIDDTEQDSEIQRWIKTAREGVEFDCELALITQTRKQYLDWFPGGPIELRTCPVQSVSSITYVDVNGTTQTLSSSLYEADTTAKPGIILPSYGNYWPSVRAKLHSVTVTFVCGYGAANAVPETAKQAILLQAGSMLRHREMNNQEEEAYKRLINRLRWRPDF